MFFPVCKPNAAPTSHKNNVPARPRTFFLCPMRLPRKSLQTNLPDQVLGGPTPAVSPENSPVAVPNVRGQSRLIKLLGGLAN